MRRCRNAARGNTSKFYRHQHSMSDSVSPTDTHSRSQRLACHECSDPCVVCSRDLILHRRWKANTSWKKQTKRLSSVQAISIPTMWGLTNRFQGYVVCWCFCFLLNANTSIFLDSCCHGDLSIVMQHIMQHQDKQQVFQIIYHWLFVWMHDTLLTVSHLASCQRS